MTGPELLDALSYAVSWIDDTCESGTDAKSRLPDDWEAQLRALIRTPKETAALRAALRWWAYVKAGGDDLEAVGRHQNMVAALDAIPDARREQIMKEGKRDG